MLRASLLALVAALVAVPARAQVTEIFKCRNADGHWTYTNDRLEAERQKCEVVTRQINVAPAPKPPPPIEPALNPPKPPALKPPGEPNGVAGMPPGAKTTGAG